MAAARVTPAFTHQERCWPKVNKYSPCEAACPLHMDVPNYVMAVASGNIDKALSIIRETNPLPSVCGRACHHPCEVDCNRKVLDSPIAIQWLKQFAADHGKLKKPTAVKQTRPARVAIIGSGPAGLTAAHDLVKKRYGVSVFEAAPVAGGIMISAIPDFILSKVSVQSDIDYIRHLGVKIHTDIRFGRDINLEFLRNQGFGAVLVAVGAQKSAMLKIPGANLAGIYSALSFLMDAKAGKLQPLTGKVWVIGGGAVSMDVARTALRNGAQEVHIACLESRRKMPAFAWEIETAKKEGVRIHPALAPHNFTSRNGSRVSGIYFKKVVSTSLDTEGRINWKLADGAESNYDVEADHVIIAVGQGTDLSGVSDIVAVNNRGLVVVNKDTGQTPTPFVFAAGDAAGTGATITGAMAAGRTAAISIDYYLSGKPMPKKRTVRTVITVKPEDIPSYFVRKDRWEMPALNPKQSIKNTREVNLGYTRWQAVEEAKRCFNCRMCANCMFERGQLCFETAARVL